MFLNLSSCGDTVFLIYFCSAMVLRISQISPSASTEILHNTRNDSKTSFEKNCFSAWASTLNMGLINKVDMVCLSPVGYGV